jgi:hypothetical protein
MKYSLSCADGDSTGPSRFSGYILLLAPDQAAAGLLLRGNPAFEAGGTVEILERVPD